MGVDKAEATAEQCAALDQREHFRIVCAHRLRQALEQGEETATVGQPAHREFAHDHRMVEHISGQQRAAERRITAAQMIDPDAGFDEQQRQAARRRGPAAASGSLPPRRARRCAASRSITAFSDSRTSTDFSFRPV
jgi:hypothetical protein